MQEFLEKLSSKEPVPGGGGACALIGAISCALCSMVANLTSGKKKYAQYQDIINTFLIELEEKRRVLLDDIKKDAEAFTPLANAYSLDKEDSKRDSIMEEALLNASNAPLKIVEDVYALVPVIEKLSIIGSRLAISDVAVAAAACRAALEGAVMNIYINTKSMKNREVAENMNEKASEMVRDGVQRCDKIYQNILEGMR